MLELPQDLKIEILSWDLFNVTALFELRFDVCVQNSTNVYMSF